MTRLFSITLAACAIGASAAGCAGFNRHAEAVPESDKVAIYEAEPPHHRPYSRVKSIWVTSGVSIGVVPGYRSAEEGRIDFRNQAVALGGDAITNFNCYRLDPTIPLESQPKLICNGNVIKFLQ
jgi:hypothetical protein